MAESVAQRGVMAEHGHQRHHAGTAAHQQGGTVVSRLPHEVAPDRAAQLQLVTDVEHAW